MGGEVTDLTLLSEAEFAELYEAVAAETRRRNRIRDLETTLNTATTEALTDAGVQPGDEWRQPTGAHDAYQVGDRVTHLGVIYTSLISDNVWSPDAYPAGWQAEPTP